MAAHTRAEPAGADEGPEGGRRPVAHPLPELVPPLRVRSPERVAAQADRRSAGPLGDVHRLVFLGRRGRAGPGAPGVGDLGAVHQDGRAAKTVARRIVAFMGNCSGSNGIAERAIQSLGQQARVMQDVLGPDGVSEYRRDTQWCPGWWSTRACFCTGSRPGRTGAQPSSAWRVDGRQFGWRCLRRSPLLRKSFLGRRPPDMLISYSECVRASTNI